MPYGGTSAHDCGQLCRTQQYQKAIILYERIMAKLGAEGGRNFSSKRPPKQHCWPKDFERAQNLCNQVQGADHETGKKRLLAVAFAQQHYARAVEYLGSLPETELATVGTPSLSAILAESLAHPGGMRQGGPLASENLGANGTDRHPLGRPHPVLPVSGWLLPKSGAHDKAIAVLEEAATIAGTGTPEGPAAL